MDEYSPRQTLFAALAVFVFTIAMVIIFNIGIKFVDAVIISGKFTLIEWISTVGSNIISEIFNSSTNIVTLFSEWITYSAIVALFLKLSSTSENDKMAANFGISSIIGAVLLLPLVWSLMFVFIFSYAKSYLSIEKPFESVKDQKMAKLIEKIGYKSRSFALNALVFSLAILAFLFTEVEGATNHASFLPVVFSTVFFLLTVLSTEYTLKYKIILELQNISLLYGSILLFLGLFRVIGQFTGFGSTSFELLFLLIVAIWSIGGHKQRNVYRIITEEDPRL